MPKDYRNSDTLSSDAIVPCHGVVRPPNQCMSKSALTTLQRCQISRRLFGGYTANKATRVKFVLAATLQ